MSDREHLDHLAALRAAVDQGRAAGQEIAVAVSEFYAALRMQGLPDSACEALTVEYLAQMFGGNPDDE